MSIDIIVNTKGLLFWKKSQVFVGGVLVEEFRGRGAYDRGVDHMRSLHRAHRRAQELEAERLARIAAQTRYVITAQNRLALLTDEVFLSAQDAERWIRSQPEALSKHDTCMIREQAFPFTKVRSFKRSPSKVGWMSDVEADRLRRFPKR